MRPPCWLQAPLTPPHLSGVNLYRATPRAPIHSHLSPNRSKVCRLTLAEEEASSTTLIGVTFFFPWTATRDESFSDRFLETCVLILINKSYTAWMCSGRVWGKFEKVCILFIFSVTCSVSSNSSRCYSWILFRESHVFKFVSRISRISKFPIAKSHSRCETYSITIFLIADLILWNNEP